MKSNFVRVSAALIAGAGVACFLYVMASAEDSRGPDSHLMLSKLFAWSNDADDGVSVLHGEQHGATRIISGCDADDPACTYHISPNFNYQQSFWSGPSEVGGDKVSVQVQKQHVLPSSIEDDIREGSDSRLGKTGPDGQFFRTPFARPTYNAITIPAHEGEVDLGDQHTGAVRVESWSGSAGNDRLFGPGPDPAASQDGPAGPATDRPDHILPDPLIVKEVDDNSEQVVTAPEVAPVEVPEEASVTSEADAVEAMDDEAESSQESPTEVVSRLQTINHNLQDEVQSNLELRQKLEELRKLTAQLTAESQAQQARIRTYVAEEQSILDGTVVREPASASVVEEEEQPQPAAVEEEQQPPAAVEAPAVEEQQEPEPATAPATAAVAQEFFSGNRGEAEPAAAAQAEEAEVANELSVAAADAVVGGDGGEGERAASGERVGGGERAGVNSRGWNGSRRVGGSPGGALPQDGPGRRPPRPVASPAAAAQARREAEERLAGRLARRG